MARKPVKRLWEDARPKTTIVRKLPCLRLIDYMPVLILFLLPTLLLWSVTFGGKTLAPVDFAFGHVAVATLRCEKFPEFHAVKAPLLDVVQQYFPWRKF